ncbi:hypothetical protein CPB86DRAFT_57762 [Serendipita vermifera]|nr:hypothetical protein CPB86DRAFT_57762 [Serendipita vermifera]
MASDLRDLSLSFKHTILEFNCELLSHELLHRVVHLNIEAETYIESESTLPLHIKSCDLAIPIGLLGSLDLKDAEELRLSCRGSDMKFKAGFLPSQLTTMTLNDIPLYLQARTKAEPHFIPHLINLTLKNSDFVAVFYSRQEGQELALKKVPLSSALAFQSFSKLERLSLCLMDLDDTFTTDIQFCMLLQYLSIKLCSIGSFIPSFTRAIKDLQTFPSLKQLDLDYSRMPIQDWSQEEFMERCNYLRPRLVVTCNSISFGYMVPRGWLIYRPNIIS